MKFLFDVFKAIHTALFPPDLEGEKMELRKWRRTVASCILFIGLMQAFQTAYAFGQVPGFSGFASASDLQSIQQLHKEMYEEQLIDRIETSQRRYCEILLEGEQETISLVWNNLQNARRKYAALMGREYPERMCLPSGRPGAILSPLRR